ncbi:uncharacterized protein RHOBADRAFT_55672 [Rhodotorula graminis WP1]|uniref:Uncharacterized protein n=1 Tax=Rhodotorula graminis (strain WP1) TaxID=578459 RepID=A0A0P9GHY6_RHOGW|nr:uncharacterized protein RHOBADRAFT_55672 [Rhodotorula graminis WP1]KPV72571.1 hypothetical protein RHOBADRAFT_55672 [Rhodotorula graminis WP1]
MEPTAPDSPYAAVLLALEWELRPTPSPGFRSRALFLEALTASYVAVALVYLTILRRRAELSSGSSTPLLRRVTLPAGRLLVLDTTYFLPCTTIVIGALSLGNLAALSSKDVGAGTGVQFALRAFRGVLLFLQGWSLTFAALQGLWVATRTRRPSARTANAVFLGVGGCGALVGLAVGFVTLVAGERVNGCYVWIRSALRIIEQNQLASVAAILRIAPGVDALREAVHNLRTVLLATFAVLATLAVGVLVLCSCGLLDVVAHEPVAAPIQLPSTPPISPVDLEKSEFIEDMSAVEGGGLVDFEALRVEKARDDLAVTCLTVGLLAVVMACSLAFSVNLAVHDRIFGVASFAAEVAHLTFAYVYSVVQIVSLSILLHHALTERTAPELPATPADNSFPTPGQLVDKVPLIRNPGFWVPKPVELPPDIHPLPEDVHAYFVYPHSLEAHVLSTLPAALDTLQQTHTQRLALLASYAESKERARKARLNQVAPGYAEGGAALEPVRRETAVPKSAAAAQRSSRAQRENLLGGSDEDEAAVTAPSEGSVLGEPRANSPGEMGAATIDKMQRDQMMDMFAGLDRLDSTLSGGGGGGDGAGRSAGRAGGDLDDLI